MIDLNHILLFIAALSPLVLLARAARIRGRQARGWMLVAVIVLLATGLAWWLAPGVAGYIGGSAWFLLLVLPTAGMRKVAAWTLAQRYGKARRLARIVGWLHPADGWVEQPQLLRAMELAAHGEEAAALLLLSRFRSDATPVGRQAIAQSFRITRDWAGLAAWCRDQLPATTLRDDAAVMPLFFRALGETGALDEMVERAAVWERMAPLLPAGNPAASLAWLPVLAFAGRTFDVAELTRTELAGLPQTFKQFWFYTAALYGTQADLGRAGLEELRTDPAAASLRPAIEDRLRRDTHHREPLSPESERTLDRLVRVRRASRPGLERRGRATAAVWGLIGLNAAVFMAELALGGSTNYETLHRLGALEPEIVLAQGEYWRLFTALFLHFGALHLFFNLYALYLLGPPLERSIGAARFIACYLVAGLGSSGGVVVLRAFHLINADLLVGASGAVMGIVGAWAGLLLRHRRAPLSGPRLKNVFAIVVLQTLFDLATPQISMAAHLNGLFAGLAIGFLLAPARLRG